MDAEQEFEIKAKLVIARFECSPAEITEIIGIHLTETWLKGEPVLPKAKNVHKSNGWMLRSPINPVNSIVDAQVEGLLQIIAPQVEAFANLPSGVYVELGYVIYTYSYRFPVMGFSQDTIKMLEKIGGAIDVDLYGLKD